MCAKTLSSARETWVGWAAARAFAIFEFPVSSFENYQSEISNLKSQIP
jgi:hypothetical protein